MSERPDTEAESGRDFCLRFGGRFPWHGSYGGVPTVMIPIEEYNRLLALSGRQTVPPAQAVRTAHAPLRLSRWDLDPEVAGFVSERLGRVPQKDIRAEVLAHFGVQRTPSPSAISRFVRRWRALKSEP